MVREELKVRGWGSEERTVQRLLDHLARLCRREGKGPSELARLRESEEEDAVQSYLDSMLKAGVSKAWIKSSMAHLVAFFRANGFKKARELDVEGYHVPSRYRKRAEYVPLPSEIAKMVVAGRDPYEKAAVLFVYESGLQPQRPGRRRCKSQSSGQGSCPAMPERSLHRADADGDRQGNGEEHRKIPCQAQAPPGNRPCQDRLEDQIVGGDRGGGVP